MQPHYSDIEKIHLSPSESAFLLKLNRKKHLPLPPNMRNLYVWDLVGYDYSDAVDPFGSYKLLGTVHLGFNYQRWKKYRRELFFKGCFPVIISLIALIKSFQNEILWLLQELMKLLK